MTRICSGARIVPTIEEVPNWDDVQVALVTTTSDLEVCHPTFRELLAAKMSLGRTLAERHGVEPESVLLTNGSTEMIQVVVQALRTPDLRVVVADPTFEDILEFAEPQASEVVKVPLLPDRAHDLDAMERVAAEGSALVQLGLLGVAVILVARVLCARNVRGVRVRRMMPAWMPAVGLEGGIGDALDVVDQAEVDRLDAAPRESPAPVGPHLDGRVRTRVAGYPGRSLDAEHAGSAYTSSCSFSDGTTDRSTNGGCRAYRYTSFCSRAFTNRSTGGNSRTFR